ncbi:restriction endonuclease subunit S [Campylobacter upsaliensis]
MKTLNDNAHPLESLLQQHCPNGVEFKTLQELEQNKILNLGRGKIISQNDLKNCPGEYPVYSSSATKNGEIGKYGKYMFDDERITWSIDGGGKFFYRNHLKYSVTNVCGWIKVINLDELNPKFLFYALINEWVKKKFNYTKKAHPSIIKKEYCIPLPPLEIQQKIVEILDAFTELEAELEAELKARLKQYEYYRNFLLSFEELYRRTDMLNGGSLELVSLGELFTIKNGYTPSKTKAEFWECGTIPWFRMEDIQKNGRILKDSIQHITPQAVKGGKLFPANSIIIATTATIGEHALVIVDYLSNQRFTCLIPQINCCDKLSMRFMFYYGFILGEWCRNNVNKSAFPSVKMDKFKKFQIPLPPLAVQNEIVEILDKFDTLTNDLTSGIPAEIEARKKQYKYYRERLLSFIVKD